MSWYKHYIPPVGIDEKKLLQMCSVEQLLTRHGQKTAEGPGNRLSVSVLKGFWLPAQGSCPKMPDVLHSQGLQCKHCSVPQGRVVRLLFKKNRRPRGGLWLSVHPAQSFRLS